MELRLLNVNLRQETVDNRNRDIECLREQAELAIHIDDPFN
jgi:hypothetical protein